MPDRDEGRDVAILARGEHLTRMVPWPLRSSLDGYYDGEVLVLRMVPHSDLEAAERERDEARKEVSRLVEALGVARNAAERVSAVRHSLDRAKVALDQAIVNLPREPITAEETRDAIRREQLSDTRTPGSSGMI